MSDFLNEAQKAGFDYTTPRTSGDLTTPKNASDISRNGTYQPRNLLPGSTNQLPTTYTAPGQGTVEVPYNTVDVPATRIPNNQLGGTTNAGSLPGVSSEGYLPPSGGVKPAGLLPPAGASGSTLPTTRGVGPGAGIAGAAAGFISQPLANAIGAGLTGGNPLQAFQNSFPGNPVPQGIYDQGASAYQGIGNALGNAASAIGRKFRDWLNLPPSGSAAPSPKDSGRITARRPINISITQFGPYTTGGSNVISYGAPFKDERYGYPVWFLNVTTVSLNANGTYTYSPGEIVIGQDSQLNPNPPRVSVTGLSPGFGPDPNPTKPDGSPNPLTDEDEPKGAVAPNLLQPPATNTNQGTSNPLQPTSAQGMPTGQGASNPANGSEASPSNPNKPSASNPPSQQPNSPISPFLPLPIPIPTGGSGPSPVSGGSVPGLSPASPTATAPKTPTITNTPGERTNPKPQPTPTPTPQPPDPTGGDKCCPKTDSDLEEIKRVLGVKDFPSTLPLLTTDDTRTINNIPELLLWISSCVDSVSGLYPAKVTVEQPDGSEKEIKLLNQAHAFEELFAAVLTVAEDADASVNIGARVATEVINTKIAVQQGNDLLKAMHKFMGFAIKPVQRFVKLNFSPTAAGPDGKLQNDEMEGFLKPSEQSYVGSECAEKTEVLPILQRVLQNSEIARAAVWQPIKPDKKGNSPITGERIRKSKDTPTDAEKKAWEEFKDVLKRLGYTVDDTNARIGE